MSVGFDQAMLPETSKDYYMKDKTLMQKLYDMRLRSKIVASTGITIIGGYQDAV